MRAIDVLIVGAGPAGLATAMHLIQRNSAWTKRVVVIDKATHPRPKVCAGGITSFGIDALARLNFKLPLPIPHAVVDTARFVYDGRVVEIRARPSMAVFDRQELDDYLAGVARERGVEIREDEAATRVTADRDGVTVTTTRATYRALVVVGADGATGIVRGAVEPVRTRGRGSRLLEVVLPATASAAPHVHRYASFDFTPTQAGLQGYRWDFPSRVGGLPCSNHGVYDSRVAGRRPPADLPALMVGSSARQFAGAPFYRFTPGNRFHAARILLVGDAAGSDPLLGEGIAPALAYGEVAAAAIGNAFAQSDFSFADYRRRLLVSRLGGYLLSRWALAAVSYRLSGQRLYMNALFGAARTLAALGGRGGRQPTAP